MMVNGQPLVAVVIIVDEQYEPVITNGLSMELNCYWIITGGIEPFF